MTVTHISLLVDHWQESSGRGVRSSSNSALSSLRSTNIALVVKRGFTQGGFSTRILERAKLKSCLKLLFVYLPTTNEKSRRHEFPEKRNFEKYIYIIKKNFLMIIMLSLRYCAIFQCLN